DRKAVLRKESSRGLPDARRCGRDEHHTRIRHVGSPHDRVGGGFGTSTSVRAFVGWGRGAQPVVDLRKAPSSSPAPRAGMGTTRYRIYATNVAMPNRTSVIAAELISPRARGNTVADTITIMIPAAAEMTSDGSIRASPGSVSPTAASTPDKPM